VNEFYIEKSVDVGLTWTFVQDYDNADVAAAHLDAIRENRPENDYRLIQILDV
jgi:hypothetical protein